jgi:hypothetical protein
LEPYRADPRGVLFYNQDTGETAVGSLSEGDFRTTDAFPAGFFAPGWTHIRDTGEYVLFYRASTGEGAIVTGFDSPAGPIQTAKSFPVDSFARGWTHIIQSPADALLMLFYNAATGGGAIAEQFDNRPPSPEPHFAAPNDIRTLQFFQADSFASGWSHIVPIADGEILFYDQQTGAGAVGTLTRAGFTTERTFPAGDFTTGWTHIVWAGDSILFYNAANGAGAIGFNPTVRSFPAGSFLVGWTHVVARVDPPPIP